MEILFYSPVAKRRENKKDCNGRPARTPKCLSTLVREHMNEEMEVKKDPLIVQTAENVKEVESPVKKGLKNKEIL